MTATVTMNHEEMRMLHTLCTYGVAVAKPLLGDTPPREIKEKWENFIRDMGSALRTTLDRFHHANLVFQGKEKVDR